MNRDPDPWAGERVQVVAGPGLRATVAADRGAKIVSLRDDAGHEWLAQPARWQPPARPGAAFVESEMCGWDECAPTIVECQPSGWPVVPDHGDLWDVAWSADGEVLRGRSRSLDVELSRTIRPCASGLRIEYEARPTVARTPFLWAAHPQFTAPPGSRVAIAVSAVVDAMHQPGVRRPWTDDLAGIDAVLPGQCAKYYAPPEVPVGRAELTVQGRGMLTMTWDAAVAPYVGVWFDHCAYAREPVIAIEPTTGYFDSLDDAIRSDRILYLETGSPARWAIELSVTGP
jgi:hypothetical protein